MSYRRSATRIIRTPLLAGPLCGLLLSAVGHAQPAETTPAPAAEAVPPAAAEPADAPVPAEAPAPVEAAPEPTAAPEAAPEAAAEEPVAEPAAAPPKPPPYSLPWQLRPVAPGNVIRSDTAIALYKPPGADKGGTTVATTLLGSYKVTDSFAPLIRLGLVSNSPPTPAAPAAAPPSGLAFMNPVVGGLYGFKFDDFRLGLFLGLTIPIGGGGGNTPKPETRTAMIPAGVNARSAMDNAMFAMNYFTIFPGVGFAYVKSGFTAQAEVTLLQLTRVKGELVDTDKSRTNMTMGLHAGYFFIPELSAGVELRHQRWISTPAPVKAAAAAGDKAPRDTSTVAIGPRAHFKLGETTWLRPGVSVALPLDAPMTRADYVIAQIDIPFVF